MRNLLLFLAKYSAFFLFLGLEILCFTLIIRYNQTQHSIFLNSSSRMSASLLSGKQKVRSYMSLQEVNDSLVLENARLLQAQNSGNSEPDLNRFQPEGNYAFIPAKVISNSIVLRNNNVTLNRGSQDGVKLGMGIAEDNGIVGIVSHVSKSYSQGISLLNSNTRISASIRKKDYFGNLVWEGQDPLRLTLEAVPKHANVSVGDTIVTSGYSAIFPPDLVIGYIESFEIDPGQSYYSIEVKLVNDLSKLNYVYIIDHEAKNIIDSLQNLAY